MILPSYHLAEYQYHQELQKQAERSTRYRSQVPYFIMAIALLAVTVLVLLGGVPGYVLIIAWFVALSKCF